MTKQAVIVASARTPIGKAFRGALNLTHGADMAAHVIKTVVGRHGRNRSRLNILISRSLHLCSAR